MRENVLRSGPRVWSACAHVRMHGIPGSRRRRLVCYGPWEVLLYCRHGRVEVSWAVWVLLMRISENDLIDLDLE
jgi:hypothetical protein